MEAVCRKFGPIRFIKYTPDLKDSFTNRAEVHFENTEDAEACVAELNNHKLGEKIVSANINNKHSKVIVIKGEVKAAADRAKEAISQSCEIFGKIAHINITDSSEKSRFVCFVEFEDKQDAEECFNKLSENPAVTLPGSLPLILRHQSSSSRKIPRAHDFFPFQEQRGGLQADPIGCDEREVQLALREDSRSQVDRRTNP